ncbi:MAG: HRDC domain-containing protein, partial [Bacteroidota bacterium]|nr:HRDC domain-containing protein [Bacteroidota bacterium]
TDAPFNITANEEPAFMRMKGAKLLKPNHLAILRELHAWRDGVAEQMDRAPFMVIGNDILLSLSTHPPQNIQELTDKKGVNPKLVERYGPRIMGAIEHGRQLPKEEWPRLPRPKRWDKDPDHEDKLRRLKIVRDRLMKEFDLRPGIIAANQLLMEIARTKPGDLEALAALPGMRRYQVANFGAALLNAL